jgi:hypothetical protein
MPILKRSNQPRSIPWYFATIALIVTVVGGIAASRRIEYQQGTAEQQKPHGGMTVLPGYVFARLRGIDSDVGEFRKPGGPTIRYELGVYRAPIASNTNPSEVLWSKTAVVHGSTAHLLMAKGGLFLVDNGSGNFVARSVKTQEDVADVLLTALSYDPEVRRRELGIKKP